MAVTVKQTSSPLPPRYRPLPFASLFCTLFSPLLSSSTSLPSFPFPLLRTASFLPLPLLPSPYLPHLRRSTTNRSVTPPTHRLVTCFLWRITTVALNMINYHICTWKEKKDYFCTLELATVDIVTRRSFDNLALQDLWLFTKYRPYVCFHTVYSMFLERMSVCAHCWETLLIMNVLTSQMSVFSSPSVKVSRSGLHKHIVQLLSINAFWFRNYIKKIFGEIKHLSLHLQLEVRCVYF